MSNVIMNLRREADQIGESLRITRSFIKLCRPTDTKRIVYLFDREEKLQDDYQQIIRQMVERKFNIIH